MTNMFISEEEEEEARKYTEEQKRQLLYEYHDAPVGGHQGARTLSRIRLKHNWRDITKDVEEYINKCAYCQKNKLSWNEDAFGNN